MSQKKALIIGGGPAGLTAALEFLKNTNIEPIVVEMSNCWGGISRTVDYKNNKIDIGGHRFFSKSDVVMQWWNDILPIENASKNIKLSYQNQTTTFEPKKTVADHDENVMLIRNRKSRIFYKNQFFDYPISLNPKTIAKLGVFETLLIGISYLKAVVFPIKNEKSLEDFFINRFGKRLYKSFFKDYTEKVWGVLCTEISAEWGAQRIKGLSITKTIIHYFKRIFWFKDKKIQQKNTETSLIEYFLYPKYGPGQMWDNVAKKITKKKGVLIQNAKVIKINFENQNQIKSVVIQNTVSTQTTTIDADYFISTMPITELLLAFDTQIPKNVTEVANGLQYRDFITVGLLLKSLNFELPDNWIYVQEPYVKVGRIQVFNNWSPFLVHDKNTHWLGLEYFCNIGDSIWNLSDAELQKLAFDEMIKMGFVNQNDFMDAVVIRMPKTYPAYFGTYNRFDEIRDFTDKIDNLFLIGRNGMHKYNNQDHSMLTAIEAVKNIKNGIHSKDNIWKINTEQEYHEEK
jgi:protoporphyrinogen oxidase